MAEPVGWRRDWAAANPETGCEGWLGRYLLADFGLVCAGCGCRMRPWELGAGRRSYDCGHGCRMRPLNAAHVEERVVAAARMALLVRTEHWSLAPARHLVRQAFSQVKVGGGETDLWFTPPVPPRPPCPEGLVSNSPRGCER